MAKKLLAFTEIRIRFDALPELTVMLLGVVTIVCLANVL